MKLCQIYTKIHISTILYIYIYEFSYKIDTVLYQFLETGTSDITFMGRYQVQKGLDFSLYPLSFFRYSLFNSFLFFF